MHAKLALDKHTQKRPLFSGTHWFERWHLHSVKSTMARKRAGEIFNPDMFLVCYLLSLSPKNIDGTSCQTLASAFTVWSFWVFKYVYCGLPSLSKTCICWWVGFPSFPDVRFCFHMVLFTCLLKERRAMLLSATEGQQEEAVIESSAMHQSVVRLHVVEGNLEGVGWWHAGEIQHILNLLLGTGWKT